MATGSLTAAAARLNLSQPSVSRLLADLEREFGCPLFVRESRGVKPTPEAVQFFGEVERSFAVLGTLEDVARDIKLYRGGILNFGTIAAFCFSVVPNALARLDIKQGRMAINWRIRDSHQLIDWVSHGHLSMALTYLDIEPNGVKIISRYVKPHAVVMPAHHPLALLKRPLQLSDLRDHRVVALTGATAEAISNLQAAPHAPKPIIVETSYAAASIAPAIEAVGIVDPFSAKWFAERSNIAVRQLGDLPPYQAALIEPIGASVSMLTKRFQEALIEELDSQPI